MFTHFDVYQGSNPLSCSDDFVEVRNGLTDISRRIGGKYCNGNRTMLITTSRNIVRIYFHSGGASLAHKGFQMHYLSVAPGIFTSCRIVRCVVDSTNWKVDLRDTWKREKCSDYRKSFCFGLFLRCKKGVQFFSRYMKVVPFW